MPEFSVIVPVYNSKDTLEELYNLIAAFFNEKEAAFEVVFVDDCSTDSSWDVIVELQQNHKHITGIKLSKNSGQHQATSCGITHAQGNFIITIDDDMQIHPSEIKKTRHKYQKYPQSNKCPNK